ncbi:MAG: hypothetical protein HOM21_08740 [Halobacteriovoraceae bacterium]|nr:hypothetical protein [Halobacteriovoraceae bacterium]
MHLLKSLAPILLALNLMACGSNNNESLKTMRPDAFSEDKAQLGLPQTVSGKLFLLGVATIDGAPTPAGSGLANKLVFFEKKKHIVYMFESLDGKLSTDSIKTKKLLAEFPVIRSIGGVDQIDFKRGMKLFFNLRSMYASDGGSAPTEKVLKVTNSYIDEIKMRGNSTYIRQIVRLDVPATARSAGGNESIELRYTLTPYQPNPEFKLKKSSLMKKVGYFETYPVLEAGSGKSVTPIMKFDLSKPITYSLTRNIPDQFKQAVKDGVLYWNRVFGREVLKVALLPEDASVHEPGFNVVQWLHWDTAGFAYANMVADPLTGETLQSHVYMTSVFGLGGIRRARTYYQRYLANSKEEPKKIELGMKDFQSSKLCAYDYSRSMKDLGSILATVDKMTSQNKDLNPETLFKRFAEDYVRQVVAHEVGHTLGLRHNFAGSLHTNIAASQFEEVFQRYFYNDEIAADTIFGATVMDYTPGKTASLLGATIRHGLKPLAYDSAAIEWGYTDKKLKDVEAPLFCTDSHRGKGTFHDCKIWDRLTNSVEGAKLDWDDALSGHSFKLASLFAFLGPKEDFQTPKPELEESTEVDPFEAIKKIRLFPKKDAAALIKEFKALADMGNVKTEFLSVRNLFPSDLSVMETPDYKKQTKAFKSESFLKVGGLTKLLVGDFTPGSDNRTPLRIMMEETFKVNFAKIYGEVSVDVMTAVTKKMTAYFNYLDRELILLNAVTLAKTKLAFRPEGLPMAIKDLVLKTSFESSNVVVGTATNGFEIRLPQFSYYSGALGLRKKVAELAKSTFGFTTSFNRQMAEVKTEIYKQHKSWLDSVLKESSMNALDDELFDYVTTEKARFSGLK